MVACSIDRASPLLRAQKLPEATSRRIETSSAGADALLRKALAMCRRSLPGDHPAVATGLEDLATLLRERAEAAAAAPLAREAADMRRRLRPPRVSSPSGARLAETPAELRAPAWSLREPSSPADDADPAAAWKLARRAADATRGGDAVTLQILAEALFATGERAEASTRRKAAPAVWQALSPAAWEARGKRDLECMPARLREYRK